MIRKAIILGTALHLALPGAVQAETGDLKAWIETEEADGGLTLKSMVMASEEATVSYKLSVEREAAAGTSRTSQGGSKLSPAGEATVLSTSRVNAVTDGTLRATLEVRDASGHVATDEISLTADKL